MPILVRRAAGAGCTGIRTASRRERDLDPIGPVFGARNRLFRENGADGKFKPAARLLTEFQELTGARSRAWSTSVWLGVTACHNLLAMEVAACGAALYPFLERVVRPAWRTDRHRRGG
jgi:thiosulfate/3-mercaptopyruvate sulfurtransferase